MREHLSPPSSRAWGQPEARNAESQCSVFWDALYGLCCDATKTLTAVQKLKPQPIEAESGLTAWSGASLKKKKKKKNSKNILCKILTEPKISKCPEYNPELFSMQEPGNVNNM